MALSLAIIAGVHAVNAQEQQSDLIANHRFASPEGPVRLNYMRPNCASPITGSSGDGRRTFEAQLCVNKEKNTFNFTFISYVKNVYYSIDFPVLCDAVEKMLDHYLAAAGYAAFPGPKKCAMEPCTDCTLSRFLPESPWSRYSWGTPTDLPLPAKLAVTPATCPATKDLAGLWSGDRPSTGTHKPPGRELVFATGASGMEGRKPYKGGPDWEADAPNSVTNLVKPAARPGLCVIHASCWDAKGNSRQCAMVMDSTARSFTIKARVGADLGDMLYGGLRYARGATSIAEPEVSCSDSDIAGNWSRADGARISIAAMNMKDGGRGLMFNAPSQWPAGVFKFSGIKAAGKCTWAAQCATVYRDTTGEHGYRTTAAACTLTLDQSKHLLTASGPHGEYTR